MKVSKVGKIEEDREEEAEEESLCVLMLCLQGPGSGAAPSVGGGCELADDEAAQMGSSLAPSSLFCMDLAL